MIKGSRLDVATRSSPPLTSSKTARDGLALEALRLKRPVSSDNLSTARATLYAAL